VNLRSEQRLGSSVEEAEAELPPVLVSSNISTIHPSAVNGFECEIHFVNRNVVVTEKFPTVLLEMELKFGYILPVSAKEVLSPGVGEECKNRSRAPCVVSAKKLHQREGAD
jgi:hypothetical protein